MKKFVNDPKDYVAQMLEGLALANPDTLKYVPEYNLIMRADAPQENKVSVMRGSGSGHEPAHVMTVGKGMLDAACPGDVFAAPPADSVTRSMGMALTACTPPAKGSPLFDLPEDAVEMGVGIHGEPGRKREKLQSTDAMVGELYLVYGRAHKQLTERGIEIGRSYVGEYCTSLDMAGVCGTPVRLDDEISDLLAAPPRYRSACSEGRTTLLARRIRRPLPVAAGQTCGAVSRGTPGAGRCAKATSLSVPGPPVVFPGPCRRRRQARTSPAPT